MCRLLLLKWALLLLPVARLAGQDLAENNFARYTASDGLSHNNITGIAQDSTGYVWLATSSGLNRYNGIRFKQFHSNSDSHSLAAEELWGMNWLDKKRLAVYTAGLHIINTVSGQTRNLYIPYHVKQYQYKFNMIAATLGDEQGNIYVLTRSGFYHFDSSYRLSYRFDYYKEEGVALEHFFFGRDLFRLDDNRLLIVSIGGLYLYDIAKKQVKKMEAGDCPLLNEFLNYPGSFNLLYLFFQPKPGSFFILKLESDTLIYVNLPANKKMVSRLPFKQLRNEFHYRTRVVPAGDTLFYITGHTSGLYKMSFAAQQGTVKFYPEKYFSTYLCNQLLKDKDNNLWIATNKGLLRQDAGLSQVQQAVIPEGLFTAWPNTRMDDIVVAGEKVYVASRGGPGLLQFNKHTFQYEKQVLFEKYGGRSNHIFAMLAVDTAKLLLGTDWLLLQYELRRKKDTDISPPGWTAGGWISDLLKDSKGNIWISAFHLYRYTPSTKTYKHIPTQHRILSVPFAMEQDAEGHIWMAGHGLARYNTITDSFDLLLDSFPYIKMPDKQVNALAIDRYNRIWFNSNNNGLLVYSFNRGTFRQFTRKDGLPDDNIASLFIIGQKLWMATYSGIACLDLETFQIKSFGKEDGFPAMPIVRGARFFYDSTQQQLYIGFANAVVRFNPYGVLRRKPPVQVFIESLVINGQSPNFLPAAQVTTSWRKNDILVTIGSINFSDGSSQRFAYRILKDGYAEWQQLGTQSSFGISNLSPGTHRIQVKSFSMNNRWPEQVKEISIVVLSPFWQKKWFIVLMSAIAVVLLYLFIRWRTGLARRKEMIKTNMQKLKAEDYKNKFELEQISNYFSSSLSGKKTIDEVLWDVAGNLIGRMNYVDCMIYLWNDDKTKMVQKAAYGPKGKPEYIKEQVFDVVYGQGIVGHVMQTCQPILLKDTRLDSRYRVDEAFRLSEICVPIIHNGELMGIIDSEHHIPNYFNERDIKILTTIATLIGNKLKQIESEQTLEDKQQELAGINEQLAEARLAALQAQMNPHFVFNALNSIKRMILEDDNEKASRYLSRFALMIRMTLNHSKDVFGTLAENIEYLEAYLDMERLRFDETFCYTIVAADTIDTEETAIPSLMIQPLVENAIWHGLMPSTGGKSLTISFARQQDIITCTIEDNGIGIRQSQKLKATGRPLHQSMGLDNLRNRIRIMNEKYHTNCTLTITDLQEAGENRTGTRVLLQFNRITI